MPTTRIDNSALTKDEVRFIQSALLARGIDPGPIDGIMGRRTEAAIIAFKARKGMKARPYVGPLTWAALQDQPGVVIDNDQLPPWIKIGLRYKGYHEVRDNAALREFLASDGHALGDPAVFPWCGDYVETCIKLALPNEPFTGDVGKNPYWALNWLKFGIPCEPQLGAIFAISRNGGGHVGFIVGEDDKRYYCLGGNQSNTVSIAPIAKSRFKSSSFRYPSTAYVPPKIVLPYMTSAEDAETKFA